MSVNSSNTKSNDFCPLRRMAADGVAYLNHRDLYRLGIVNNKTTLNRWISGGKFPRPFYPEERSPRWPIGTVIAWDEGMRAPRPQ